MRVPEASAGGALRAPLLEQTRALFSAYRDVLLAADVPIDLFQGFADEIAALPGPYVAERRGLILLAFDDGAGTAPQEAEPALAALGRCLGCVALKDLDGSGGEVKRLFVLPAARRRGVAQHLCAALEAAARDFGYASLALDTLDRLPGALELYARLGYAATERYNDNPLHDVRFLRKALR